MVVSLTPFVGSLSMDDPSRPAGWQHHANQEVVVIAPNLPFGHLESQKSISHLMLVLRLSKYVSKGYR
ncbi:hypothetical protein ACLOJK_020062 [Asimina triloba]